MQLIQDYFGVKLERISGHICINQTILYNGESIEVNSYHNLGAVNSVSSLTICGLAGDGVVEAVKHVELPIMGIMWHPERMSSFSPRDIRMFQQHFGG